MHSILNKKQRNIFSFTDDFSGVDEYQIILHTTKNLSFEKQFEDICKQYDSFIESLPYNVKPILKRYFLSDSSNQESYVKSFEEGANYAISIVQQPPLDGTKIALWVWLQTKMEVNKEDDLIIASHGNYSHYWLAGCSTNVSDSEYQCNNLFENYEQLINAYDCNIASNCIRTWLFVQNVDVNYAGVVKGRRDYFDKIDLTNKTHYIASTGIEGRTADHKSLVLFDAYAVKGIKESQIQYLYAPEYLNPTYEYGVTFERGTAIHYGDRSHVFISGTASINNKGEVVHPGNIKKQIERTWINVEALLKEVKCSFDNLASVIVYLRDIADYEIAQDMFKQRFGNTPLIIVLAPVCRPGWLIEMECIAIRRNYNKEFDNF